MISLKKKPKKDRVLFLNVAAYLAKRSYLVPRTLEKMWPSFGVAQREMRPPRIPVPNSQPLYAFVLVFHIILIKIKRADNFCGVFLPI